MLGPHPLAECVDGVGNGVRPPGINPSHRSTPLPFFTLTFGGKLSLNFHDRYPTGVPPRARGFEMDDDLSGMCLLFNHLRPTFLLPSTLSFFFFFFLILFCFPKSSMYPSIQKSLLYNVNTNKKMRRIQHQLSGTFTLWDKRFSCKHKTVTMGPLHKPILPHHLTLLLCHL